MDTITLDALNAATPDAFVAALGDIYEHAPWVAAAAARRRPFAGVAGLHAALAAAVDAAPEAERLVLVRNHPDLAGRAARAGEVTAHSAAEQAGAGLDRLSDAEYAAFHRLNDAYRAKFGFPFIVCVGRHTKDSILRQFERRLANAPADELATALAEVARIAALRLDRLVEGPDRLRVAGRLSTHVLDTHAGRPAAGVAVELVEIAAAGPSRLLARAATNADGRTDAPLITGRPVPIGTYELRFAIGDYFAAQGVAGGEPRFLDVVPLRFAVAEPEGHYHVPLLASPWSYTTYRGS
ncbi:MAG: 2-oxo-4-hydroxy-4-carboxy-5-ureidoimidazoline decarboxylase [Alphaproteobacteria bacterium]